MVLAAVFIEPVESLLGEVPRGEVTAQVLLLLALPLLPLTTAVAVLRHRLWGIDAIINRAAFWLVASTAILALYAGSVAIAGVLLGRRGATASALAAGVVAVTFQPVRARVQASVDRMIYGERGDPLALLRRLGATLGTAVNPRSALQQAADTLGGSLGLDMVVIEVAGAEPHGRLAQWGANRSPDAVFPLVYGGEHVGQLLIACRTGDHVGPRLRAAIDDLCAHVAAVAAASRFEHELVSANRRILAVRNDERRRLRRDLHDGLGPSLAGMALGMNAARNQLALGNGERAAGLLDELTAELEHKVGEVRAIVYGLRPHASRAR